MRRIVGYFRKNVIDALNLSIEPDTPIYIADSNIEHMQKSHSEDYNRYFEKIERILEKPDYVGKNPKDDSVEFVKEYKIDGNFVKVAVRISTGNQYFARSLYVLNPTRVRVFFAKGTLKEL